MKSTKQRKIEDAGWTIGSASTFLKLSEADDTIVAMKLALASELRGLRLEQKLTQQELAKRLGSSQSRVAKMEVADKSVSIELFVKSLITLGASQGKIGKVIGKRKTQRKSATIRPRKQMKSQATR